MIILKIWLTMLVLFLPLRIAVDITDGQKIGDYVKAFTAAWAGVFITLFFVMIIIEIWSF